MVVVALVAFVAVTLAAESFHNGIKHNGTQDIRPHRITDRKGKGSQEQVAHYIFVRIQKGIRHQESVVVQWQRSNLQAIFSLIV